MARIDLGRYDNSISKAVPVADVATDPNAGTYRALGQLGGQALELGNAIYQKEQEIKRKADAWSAYDKYTQQMTKDKLTAKSQWDQLGNVDGKPYAQYISQRSDTVSQDIGQGIDDADTREMFTRMVRPDDLQTKVGGVVETQQRKLTAAPEYYLSKAGKIASEAVDINSKEATDFVVDKLDQTLSESNDIIGTFDQDSKRKTGEAILLTGGRALSEKYTSLHLTEVQSAPQVLSEFTGVNIIFDSQQRKYFVNWLNANAPEAERQQMMNEYLQQSASKLKRLAQLGSIPMKTDPSLVGNVNPMIEEDGSISMDVISLEGEIIEKVKLPDAMDPIYSRVENRSTKYFNSLPAKEKIDFYEKILKQKFEQDDTAEKEYRLQLDNIIAAPGVDSFNTKGSNLSPEYTIGRLSALMNSPMRIKSKVTPTEAATLVTKYSKNMVLQQASDDLITFGPSFDMTDERAAKITKGVAARVFQPNDPALAELSRPEAGATILAPMNLQLKKEFRAMKAQYASNPVGFIQKYGNQRIQRIFDNGIDTNGAVNMNVIAQQKQIVDKLTKNFGIAGTADDSIMFKPSVNNLSIALERAQQQGPQAVQQVLGNIANIDPAIRGKVVKELVKSKALSDEGEGSTLAYSFLGGNSRDQVSSMQLAELQDLNTKSTREAAFKNFNTVFGTQSGMLYKAIDTRFNEVVKDKLSALYGDASKESQPILKALKSPIMASVMQKATLGMDENQLSQLVDAEFERHIGSRVSSVNEGNLRGVFPKVQDIDQVVDQADEKAGEVRKDILSGKVKIDWTQYPELNATLIGRKSGTSKFMQPNTKEEQFLKTYDLSYDGVDPFGGSGKLRLMLKGKGGKTAPLKILDSAGKSVDYPVDWAVK